MVMARGVFTMLGKDALKHFQQSLMTVMLDVITTTPESGGTKSLVAPPILAPLHHTWYDHRRG